MHYSLPCGYRGEIVGTCSLSQENASEAQVSQVLALTMDTGRDLGCTSLSGANCATVCTEPTQLNAVSLITEPVQTGLVLFPQGY